METGKKTKKCSEQKTKKCIDCERYKPMARYRFYKRKGNSKGYYRSRCKGCERDRRIGYYAVRDYKNRLRDEPSYLVKQQSYWG